MTDSPRILVVEDEQVVAMDIELQLEELGYRVTGIASSGKEALHSVEQNAPDLVLMDIQLHGQMDGITAAGHIRERWQIPVIFVTAYANRELVTRASETGPYGYLTKPYTTKELNATIAVALEQHHLVREMFAEHGWLRTMLAGMNDGVIATDAAGKVKYLNPVAEKLTGWTLREANGLPIEAIYTLFTEEGEALEMCQLRRVLVSGEPIGRQRFLLTARGGRQLNIEDSAAPIRDTAGELAGAVTVIVDTTERQRIERERDRLLQELARSNADLEKFAYAVAHDLQSPVRTVRSFADLLSRRLTEQLSEDNAQILKFLVSAAANMEQLIRSLLDYALAGHGVIHREELRMTDIVNVIQSELAGIIADTGTRISCGPLPTVSGDPIQLKQLVQNLLVNAIQYRSPERPLRTSISGETRDEEWHIVVADNGQGIAPEHQNRIFDLLTRFHGPEIPGSGIGLALCRTIVERHGGKIWCESNGSGQGATFHFTIGKPQQKSGSGDIAASATRHAHAGR